ncbi:MAG: hypothetical protein NTX27_00755, partial [Verrucomicrobia bacterium]|nr:hypothetical protein [Verrucomicrobiota bacterium]
NFTHHSGKLRSDAMTARRALNFPDDPNLDVKRSADGRATLSVLHFVYSHPVGERIRIRRSPAITDP